MHQTPTARVCACCFGRTGRRSIKPYDLDLWTAAGDAERPASVVAPVDPAAYGLDPLTLL